jgi:anaerobic sulfite reductase subunit C
MGLDIKELKENGFLQQVDPEKFALRVRVVGGQFSADKLLIVGEIAQKYGDGTVHFTSRQAVEVPHIKTEDIEAVRKLILDNGMQPGILGARVRTITACQGSAVCKHGKIQTTELANRITDATLELELPHKFKVGITGCCNNCLKAEENDLGIKGGVQPTWLGKNCNYCGACQTKCPVGAITIDKDKQKLAYDADKCVNCGKCVQVCTKKDWEGKNGFLVYFGGTFGNRILIGQRILPIVFSDEDVITLVLKALKFYQDKGNKGERFGFMLEREGMNTLKDALLEEV